MNGLVWVIQSFQHMRCATSGNACLHIFNPNSGSASECTHVGHQDCSSIDVHPANMSQPELLFARSLARSLGCLGAGCLLAWLVAFACLLACWLAGLTWLGLVWLGLAWLVCLLA